MKFDRAARRFQAKKNKCGVRKLSDDSVGDEQAWVTAADADYANSWGQPHWNYSTYADEAAQTKAGRPWKTSWNTSSYCGWDDCYAQKDPPVHEPQSRDVVSNRWREKRQSNAATDLDSKRLAESSHHASTDHSNVYEVCAEGGLLTPSRVSTASGNSSPASSFVSSSPRANVLTTLKTCLPNAAIRVGECPTAKQEQHCTVLSQSPLLDSHDALVQRVSADGPSLAKNLSHWHVELERKMQDHARHEAESAHLLTNVYSAPHQPPQAPAMVPASPFVASSSSYQATSPPLHMPGCVFSTFPAPPAPSYSPDLTAAGWSYYQDTQAGAIMHSSWHPPGFELASTIDQSLIRMFQASVAGATVAEIEHLLRSAQPHVYED